MGKKIVLFVLSALIFCSVYFIYAKDKKKEGKPMELKITSTAFSEGGMIPIQYTCDGRDISPPLIWTRGPEGTKSYALISDDPDAPVGTWVHWVAYNIPASSTSLPENVSKGEKLDDGTLQGVNDFKKHGYGGPCPPGGTHRYYFKLYALDTELKAGPGLTKKNLLKEMDSHIVGNGELMGRYSR
jgi:Raf kinase inhibitor-like YbhB/YbcL family protein